MEPKTNKKVAKNSSVYVSRTIGRGAVEQGDEGVLAVHDFVTQPAQVSVTVALNMNLGNYESAKVSVSLTLPCYSEEIDQAYEFAQKWAEERVGKERDLIVESRRRGSLNPL